MKKHSLPALYSKTSKGTLNIWTISTEGPHIHTEWGPVGGQLQNNSVQVSGKNIGKTNETLAREQAALEAQSKWEKQKRLKYFENPAEAMGTLNVKPMRAYSLDNRVDKLSWPVTVQPKYDGVRCMAYLNADGSVRLMSRGGKDYTAPHIQEALRGRLEPGICLDGELYVHGESLQTIRHLQAEEDTRLTYHVYDITAIPTDHKVWKNRKKDLDAWFAANKLSCVVKALSATVNDLTEVRAKHDEWVDAGYEGAMVRTMDGPYKLAGKSTDLLKYKMFQDAEFTVVGFSVSKDGVPLFKCVQEEGLEFDVRPVGDAETRKRLLEEAPSRIGQLLTVKFQSRSDDNIPTFGVGKAFRSADDLDQPEGDD
jgi:ATP-dependent DNA ligase